MTPEAIGPDEHIEMIQQMAGAFDGILSVSFDPMVFLNRGLVA